MTGRKPRIVRCKECGRYVDPRLGKSSPAETQGHAGTRDDPRAPGDYDDICDVCCYGPTRGRGRRT